MCGNVPDTLKRGRRRKRPISSDWRVHEVKRGLVGVSSHRPVVLWTGPLAQGDREAAARAEMGRRQGNRAKRMQ